ncbi:MAG: hypothetical protein UW94_C0018G0018 [Parcubacteria group bacterium GW2011_GWA2_45_14]|nr:MAG: hypothetical protein UW94_C0018G0018 [Parcubacteria group bacterium GW2011_GWA2_45_14]
MASDISTTTEPSLDEWRRLYQAAQDFRNLAPWNWMSEAHLFSIATSDMPEIGYCSIQGALGEHLALAVYRGPRGLAGLNAVRRMKGPDLLDMLLVNDMLMASFEDHEYLEQSDRNLIKKLGLSFRGAKEWPLIRSYQPRYAPWYLTAHEARFLTDALQQAIVIAQECHRDPASACQAGSLQALGGGPPRRRPFI